MHDSNILHIIKKVKYVVIIISKIVGWMIVEKPEKVTSLNSFEDCGCVDLVNSLKNSLKIKMRFI